MLKESFYKKLICICCMLTMLISTLPASADSGVVITTTPENGATEVACETTVTVSTNDYDIDFDSLEDLGSDAITVSGADATVGAISYNDLDDPCIYSFTLSNLAQMSTYTVNVKVPLYTGSEVAEKSFSFTTASKCKAYVALDSLEYDIDDWDDGASHQSSPLDSLGRHEVGWSMNCDRTYIKDGVLEMHSGISGSGYQQPGAVTGVGTGLHTCDIKNIQMRVRVSSSSRMKVYYQSSENPNFAEGDAEGDKTILSKDSVSADGEFHIVTLTPTSSVWVNNANRILTQLWFQAEAAPAVFEIDWIRFMGEDGATELSSRTAVSVSTQGDAIDFAALEALGKAAVEVKGGKATVGNVVYDASSPYDMGFSLTGLGQAVPYTAIVKIPLAGGGFAKKAVRFTTGGTYEVLDSLEYEGYNWEHYEADKETPAKSPATGFNRYEVEWSMNCDHTVISNGILTMEAGKGNTDTGYSQPGTITQIGSGLHTNEVKSIQMRVRASTETWLKIYYQSNENANFEEGDAKGDKTILSDGRVLADKKWHIVTFTPTSNAWANNENRTLTQLWIQAVNKPGLFEIDWIRFMGKGVPRTSTVQKEATIVKYDNTAGIESVKNDLSVNPDVSYDAASKAIKCSGATWSKNCDIYVDGVGIKPERFRKIIMRVKADKLMSLRLEFMTNFNESLSGGYALDAKDFYVPGDGQWHDVEIECTKDGVPAQNQLGQIHIIPQAVSAKDNALDGTEITADGNYYIQSTELYGDATVTSTYKYDFENPEIERAADKCVVKMPSIVNYSSNNLNLGFISASYENGKLANINCVNKPAGAGQTVSAFEFALDGVPQTADVKTFIWDMDTLCPLSANDVYNDALPDYASNISYKEPEVIIEPGDKDFEGKTKVLILGNSYTYHAPGNIYTNGQYVNWTGQWGMAASAQDKDYAHLLRSYAKAKNDDVAFMIKNIYAYESNPASYQNELPALKEAADLDADIIILAIGTNMSGDIDRVEEAYKALIDYVDADHDAQVICAMLLGTADTAKYQMYKASNDKNCVWVDLTDKCTAEYLAIERFGENGVGWHYGDNGMKMVADNIWNGREYLADYIKTTGGVTADTTNVRFKGLKDFIPEPSIK